MNKMTIVEVIKNDSTVFKETGKKLDTFSNLTMIFSFFKRIGRSSPRLETHEIPGKDIPEHTFDDSVLTIYLRNRATLEK